MEHLLKDWSGNLWVLDALSLQAQEIHFWLARFRNNRMGTQIANMPLSRRNMATGNLSETEYREWQLWLNALKWHLLCLNSLQQTTGRRLMIEETSTLFNDVALDPNEYDSGRGGEEVLDLLKKHRDRMVGERKAYAEGLAAPSHSGTAASR
jgi:hypothetical protein